MQGTSIQIVGVNGSYCIDAIAVMELPKSQPAFAAASTHCSKEKGLTSVGPNGKTFPVNVKSAAIRSGTADIMNSKECWLASAAI